METFTQKGGAKIGKGFWLSFDFTFPFAKLYVYPEQIIITILNKDYIFSKEEVEKLSAYSLIVQNGIKIQYSNSKYPKFIVFWSFNLDELKENLGKLGYQVV